MKGKDASRYLQGRLSQDISKLALGQALSSLALTPQGKIEAKILLIKNDIGFLILVEQGSPGSTKEEFIQAILKFKVADDVEIIDLTEKLEVVSIIGESTPNAITEITLANAKVDSLVNPSGLPQGIYLIVDSQNKSTILDLLKNSGFEEDFDLASFHRARIKQKIPFYGIDLSEKTYATEVDYTELISFKKGCYAGQEFVEMSIARGRPNKRLALFLVKNYSQSLTGKEITTTDENNTSLVVGVVTSCTLDAEGNSLALGFIKTSIDSGAKIQIDDQSATEIK